MNEREEIIKELKHLAGYHSQATYEFFNDLQKKLAEKNDLLAQCLRERVGTLEDVRRLIELLVDSQENLRKRVEDLDFLTSKMLKLLAEPRSFKKDLGGLKRKGSS